MPAASVLILGFSLLAGGDRAAVAMERKDVHGDPLPPGALARFGTLRQRAPDSHLAVTADGKEIVAAGRDLTVRRFDAQTGELRTIRQLPRDDPFVFNTCLSPHGTFLLVAHVSGPGAYHLDLWDLAQGKRRQSLRLPVPPQGLAFSRDERRVAIADSSEDRQRHRVLVWDFDSTKPQVVWSETKKISSYYFEPVVALSPDGKRLAACHLDQILRCWDAESGKLLWQSDKKIWSGFLFFSADGRTVLAPAGLGIAGIRLHDAATGKLLEGQRSPPKEAVYPLGFSPDGRFLAFQTGLEVVVLWEPGKEKITFRFPRPPHHRDASHFSLNQRPTNFAFTPDSKGFIRRAGALQRWDLTAGKAVYADTENWGHTEEVSRLLFSPDGRMLASSAKDQTVRLWEVSTARMAHVIPKGLDHLAFTPDGRSLLTSPNGLDKAILRATDVSTGRAARGFELADRREFTPSSGEKEIRVTPDGKKLLMLACKIGPAGDESMLTTWNAATGECLVHKRVPWRDDSLLTPDGRSVLAIDSTKRGVKLLALDTGEPRWQLRLDESQDTRGTGSGCSLAMSPDGRLIAARSHSLNLLDFHSEFDAIRLADLATGRQLHKLPIEGAAVFDFSADHRLLAVAGPAGVSLWETITGREVGSIPVVGRKSQSPNHACAVSLAFSPDGRTLATGHADGTILLWDATLPAGAHGVALNAAEREALWTHLAGADAAKAYAAVWRLAEDPKPSVLFLKKRLRPVPPVPPEILRSLLDDLDSERFAVREEAERKLRDFGERVVSALREALKAKPSLEKRRRIEGVLTAIDNSDLPSGDSLRALRAVQVLERIGSAGARTLLEDLSRGVESARLTQAAQGSLTRLKKR